MRFNTSAFTRTLCPVLLAVCMLVGTGPGGRAAGTGTSGSYSILPLDLQIRTQDAFEWQGGGVTGSKEAGPEDTATQQWVGGQRRPCIFLLRVKNPPDQNSDVPASAYTIYARPRNSAAALYTFNLGRPSSKGADITDAIMSDAGYDLDRFAGSFRPGDSLYITVTVVPVGPANEPRGIRVFWKSRNPSLSDFIPIAVPTDRLPEDVVRDAETGSGDSDYGEGEHTIALYENPNKGGKKKKGGPSGSSMGLINVGSYSCGTPEIVDAIENGFNGAIVGTDAESIPMPVNPGFRKGPVEKALQKRAGEVVYVPVHDSVSGNGRNASYEVSGLARCRISSSGDPSQGASVLNYWNDLQGDDLPTEAGANMYDSVDVSVSVSGSRLKKGPWEEVN